MRILLASLLAVLLIGCAVSEKQLAFNRFSIETEYGGETGYFEAVDELSEKAGSLCDGEYRKVNDYNTSQGEIMLLVWEVVCDGLYRSEQIFTRKVNTD